MRTFFTILKKRIIVLLCVSMMLESLVIPTEAAVLDGTESLSNNEEIISENEEDIPENKEAVSEDEEIVSENQTSISENVVPEVIISGNEISENGISENEILKDELTATQKRFWELTQKEYDVTQKNSNIPEDELKKRAEIIGVPRPENNTFTEDGQEQLLYPMTYASLPSRTQVYSDAMLTNQRTDDAYLDFYRMPIYTEESEENELINVTAQMILEDYVSDNDLGISANELTELQKVRAAHDWICEHVYYDNECYNNIASASAEQQNADAVLKSVTRDPDYQTTGYEPRMLAVCQGYANLTEAILRAYGIPCITVIGYGGVPSVEEYWEQYYNHAWNHVYLTDEGGDNGQWYFMDNTWDSGSSYYLLSGKYIYSKGEVKYQYYNKASYPRDHSLIKGNWESGVPKAFEPIVDADGTCRIPDGIKYLESSAFDNVTGVKKIEMPDSVVAVEEDSLNVSGLESIDLSRELAAFHRGAIWSSKLKHITMNGEKEYEGVNYSVSDNAIYGGTAREALILAVGPDDSTKFEIADTTKYILVRSIQGSRINSLVIPDSVKSMNMDAFRTEGLERLDVGKNLTRVYSPQHLEDPVNWRLVDPNRWFLSTDKNVIQEINISEDNTRYSSVNGVVYNKEKTKLIYIPVCYQEELVMVEDTVIDTNYGVCNNESVIVAMPDGITDTVLSNYSGNTFGGICANSGSTLEQYATRNRIPFYKLPYMKTEDKTYHYMRGETPSMIVNPATGYQLHYRWIKSDTQNISEGNVLSGETDFYYTPDVSECGSYYLWMQASRTSDFSSDVVTSGMFTIHVTDSVRTYLEEYHFSMQESQVKTEEDIEQYINRILAIVNKGEGQSLEVVKVSYSELTPATTDSFAAMQGEAGEYSFKIKILSNGELIDTTNELKVEIIPKKIFIKSVSYSPYDGYFENGQPITLEGIRFSSCTFSDGSTLRFDAQSETQYGIEPCIWLNGSYLCGDAIGQVQESYFNQPRYFRYLSSLGYVYKPAGTIHKIEPEYLFKNLEVTAGSSFSHTLQFPGTIKTISKLSGSLPNGLTLKINDTKTGLVISGTPTGGIGGKYYYKGCTSTTVSGAVVEIGFSIEVNLLIPSYEIHYVLDGSTNNVLNPTGYQMGDTGVVLKKPIMESDEYADYVFYGWYTDEEFTNRIYKVENSTISKAQDGVITLYAKWLPPWEINYDLKGGTVSGNMPKYVGKRFGSITLGPPIKENHKFLGWYERPLYDSDPIYILDCTKVTRKLNLFARWGARHTISYNLYGGTNNEENPSEFYVADDPFTLLPPTLNDSEREGYEFGGWYTNTDYTKRITKLNFDQDEDIILYAKWVAPKTITWALNGGTYSGNMPLYYHDSTETLTLGSPEKDNARFDGWYRNYDAETNVYWVSVDSIDFSKEKYNITLYAKWKNKHSISYNLDGGTNNVANPIEFYVGDDAFTLLQPTLNDAKREGYIFLGWYTDPSFTNKITDLDFTKEKDIVLYAKWGAPPIVTHKITWFLNAGTCSGNMPTEYHANSEPLTLPIPEREDCKFGGWYRTYNSTTKEYSDPVTRLDFSEEDGDITLRAKWLFKYRITYNWMSTGTNAAENPKFFYVGDPAFTLLEPTVSDAFRNSYVFDGWYSDAKCTIPMPILTFEQGRDINVYANWLSFDSITWELNGGTCSGNMPLYYTEKTPVLTLETPTKENHRFVGWFRSYNAQTDVYSDPVTAIDFVNETADITLYAKWQGRHDIIYHLNGGENAEDNLTEFYVGDEDFTLLPPTLNDPSRAGYVFDGWYTDEAFTQAISVLNFNKEDDIVLFAKWIKNGVSINEVPYAWTTNNHIYVNWNNGSTKNKTITLNLPENSTYQLSKTSCIKDLKKATLKITGKGTASITVKKEGIEDKTITISVVECMPRFDTNALKLNKYNSQPVTHTVYSTYRTNLSATEGVFYQKADENSPVVTGLRYQVPLENGMNGIYRYELSADETAKTGTYTVYMKCVLDGGSIQMPQSTMFIPLKLTVIGKLPKVSTKITKINAFYTDERSEGVVTFGYSEALTISNISMVVATGKNMPTQEILDQWYSFEKIGDAWKLSIKEGTVTDMTTLSMLPKKARFCIETQEYGTIYTGNITLPVILSAPKVIASKSSFVLSQYMGTYLNDYFLVSEKVGTQVIPANITSAYAVNVTKNEETPAISCNGSQVEFLIDDALHFSKSKKIKVYVKDENWAKTVAVPITIQTTVVKPTGKLSKNTLDINLSYTGITDSATLTFNHMQGAELLMPNTLEPTGKNTAGKAPIVEISQNEDGTYTICAKKSDTTLPGNYSYKLIPKVERETETIPLKTISFTVKVSRNKKPADVSLTVQKGGKIEVTDLNSYCYCWKPKLLNVKGTITDVSFASESPDFRLVTHKAAEEQGAMVESFDIYLSRAVATGKYILPLQMQIRQIDGVVTYVVKNVTVSVTEQSAKVNFSKSSEILYLSVEDQEKRIKLTPVSNPGATFSLLTVEIPSSARGILAQCDTEGQTVALKILHPELLAPNKTYSMKVKYQFEGGKRIYVKTISVKVKE